MQAKLALEFDGAETHGGEENRLRDITRDAELLTIGISTIHLPYERLMEEPEWCRKIYRGALAAAASAAPTGDSAV